MNVASKGLDNNNVENPKYTLKEPLMESVFEGAVGRTLLKELWVVGTHWPRTTVKIM